MVYLSKEQMESVYKQAVDVVGMSRISIMNNAGKNCADFIENLKPKKVVVCCGAGNAGGVGLVIARFLHDRKLIVEIVLAEKKVKDDTIEQLSETRKKEIIETQGIHAGEGDVVVDALIGYNLNETPRGQYAVLIDQINNARTAGAKIVSVDVPTGIDATTGFLYVPHVVADYTLSLGLPKSGMKEARDKVGELYLIDIGISDGIYSLLHIPTENYFGRNSIIKIW